MSWFLYCVVILFIVYAALIYPTQVKARLVIEILKTYQLELQAKVENSKVEEIFKNLNTGPPHQKE